MSRTRPSNGPGRKAPKPSKPSAAAVRRYRLQMRQRGVVLSQARAAQILAAKAA